MKITVYRCQRCRTPLAIVSKGGERTCANCGRDPELSPEDIDAIKKRQKPSAN